MNNQHDRASNLTYIESLCSACKESSSWEQSRMVSWGTIKNHRFLTLKNNNIKNRSRREAHKGLSVWGWPAGTGRYLHQRKHESPHSTSQAGLPRKFGLSLDFPQQSFFQSLWSWSMKRKHWVVFQEEREKKETLKYCCFKNNIIALSLGCFKENKHAAGLIKSDGEAKKKQTNKEWSLYLSLMVPFRICALR